MRYYIIATIDTPCWAPEDPELGECPACGDPGDYCPGHGEIGDPEGHATLQAHDAGDHSTCKHEMQSCHDGKCGPPYEEDHDDHMRAFTRMARPWDQDYHPLSTWGAPWLNVDDEHVTCMWEGEYSYLAEKDRNSPWAAHHAGQAEGFIDQSMLDTLLDEGGFYIEDVQTMGTLTEWGHMPALAANLDTGTAIGSMYVTPIPEWTDPVWPMAATKRDTARILHELGYDDLPGFDHHDGGWELVRAEVLTINAR